MIGIWKIPAILTGKWQKRLATRTVGLWLLSDTYGKGGSQSTTSASSSQGRLGKHLKSFFRIWVSIF